jgi:hypothetical protein
MRAIGVRPIVRVTRLAGAALMIMAPLALADVKRHEFMPDALHGSWAGAGGCGKPDNTIAITDKTYAIGQTRCTVDWVSETAGETGPIFSARLQCTASGDAAPKTQSRILWPKSAGHLSIGSSFDDLQDYARFPAQ